MKIYKMSDYREDVTVEAVCMHTGEVQCTITLPTLHMAVESAATYLIDHDFADADLDGIGFRSKSLGTHMCFSYPLADCSLYQEFQEEQKSVSK